MLVPLFALAVGMSWQVREGGGTCKIKENFTNECVCQM